MMKITKTILDTAHKIETLEKQEAQIRRKREALISWLDGLTGGIANIEPPPTTEDIAPATSTSEDVIEEVLTEVPVAAPKTVKRTATTEPWQVIVADLDTPGKAPGNMAVRLAQLFTQKQQFKTFHLKDLYRFFKAKTDSHKATIRHTINDLHKRGWVEQVEGRGNYKFNASPNRSAYENRRYRREPVSARANQKRVAQKREAQKRTATKKHADKSTSAVTFANWNPQTEEGAWVKELFISNRDAEISTQEVYELLEIDDDAIKARVRAAINRMIRLGFLEKVTRGVYRVAFESINLRKQVFECIKQHKLKNFTPSDVIERLHVPSEKKDSVRAEVWKMMRAGILTRNDHNLYSLK